MRSNRNAILYATMLAMAFGANVKAQTVFCVWSAFITGPVRAEGLTEPLTDMVMNCTGGTPTAANQPVPQVNIYLILNTNLTSQVTAASLYDEALLLIDNPNTINNGAQNPLLNCGQTGAQDNVFTGPGICSIVSTGNAAQTYNGATNVRGTGACLETNLGPIGCGRPNAFQGRLEVGSTNIIVFQGVPFDPPGPGNTRSLRFTNIRADAHVLGTGADIIATFQISGQVPVSIATGPIGLAGTIAPGISSSSSPSAGKILVTEGFPHAWKDRNVAFTVGNSNAAQSGNATYATPPWTWNDEANYPTQIAQNVPGTVYYTEDMFQWQPPAVNGPPSPNPPVAFGINPVLNIGYPLQSHAFAGVDTGIENDGVSSQGTRIALSFSGPNAGEVVCQNRVPIYSLTYSAYSGAMVMTTTDANGAGVYTPVLTATGTSNTNLAVYEVLWSDPFSMENVTIPCYSKSGTINVTVTPSFAPFYTGASAGHPTPTTADPTPTALPRFAPGTSSFMVTVSPLANLP